MACLSRQQLESRRERAIAQYDAGVELQLSCERYAGSPASCIKPVCNVPYMCGSANSQANGIADALKSLAITVVELRAPPCPLVELS